MKRTIISLLALAGLSLGLAEPWDGGVREQKDEFTGESTCSHRVDNGPDIDEPRDNNAILLTRFDDGAIWVGINRGVESWGDSAFFSDVYPGDRVLVRFAEGDVETYLPVGTNLDFEYDIETAYIASGDLAHRIMSAPHDIRVRFDGEDGIVDFTIDHGVAVLLAEGFGQRCL